MSKLYYYLTDSFYKPDEKIYDYIRALFAERYSEDLHKKSKRANYHRITQGDKSSMLVSKSKGYYKEDGKIKIDEAAAAVVKMIFEMDINEDIGLVTTTRIVNDMGYKWSKSTISRMLVNKKYIGEWVMNKTLNVFGKGVKKENPEDEWIVREFPHTAIIDKTLFTQAKIKIKKRSRPNR